MICVIRAVHGKDQILPLADQHRYREWTGCFTLLTENLQTSCCPKHTPTMTVGYSTASDTATKAIKKEQYAIPT